MFNFFFNINWCYFSLMVKENVVMSQKVHDPEKRVKSPIALDRVAKFSLKSVLRGNPCLCAVGRIKG